MGTGVQGREGRQIGLRVGTGLLAGLLLLGIVALTTAPGLAAAGRRLRPASSSAPDPEQLRIERTLQKIERLRDRRERQERAERWRELREQNPNRAGDQQDR